MHKHRKGTAVAQGCAASGPVGRSEELPAWLSQCLKPAFTLSAMKHSHGFCFTSVIAYNSMKLQPELISLAADKGSCQVWQRVITQGDQKEGAASPRLSRRSRRSRRDVGVLRGGRWLRSPLHNQTWQRGRWEGLEGAEQVVCSEGLKHGVNRLQRHK